VGIGVFSSPLPPGIVAGDVVQLTVSKRHIDSVIDTSQHFPMKPIIFNEVSSLS
jgi:hypothetical protein